MKTIDDLYPEEWNELETEIDHAFKSRILKPRKQSIVDFLIKVQNLDFEFRKTGDTKEIKVISLYYYSNSPLGFLFVQPCYAYYSDSNTVNRPELHADDYTYEDLEEIVFETLAKHKIDTSEFTEDDEADIYDFWDNDTKLIQDFLIDCWKTAKSVTQSKLIGFLDASDYSGATYDLDSGYSLFDNNVKIEEYLESKNIKITKDKELLK